MIALFRRVKAGRKDSASTGEPIQNGLSNLHQSEVFRPYSFDFPSERLGRLNVWLPGQVGDVVRDFVRRTHLGKRKLKADCQAVDAGQPQRHLSGGVFVDGIGLEQSKDRREVSVVYRLALHTTRPCLVNKIVDLVANATYQLDRTDRFLSGSEGRLTDRDPRRPDCSQDRRNAAHRLKPSGPICALANDLDRYAHGRDADTILARAA